MLKKQDRFGSAGASFFVSSCCSHYSTVISKLSDENRIMAQRLTIMEHRLRSDDADEDG